MSFSGFRKLMLGFFCSLFCSLGAKAELASAHKIAVVNKADGTMSLINTANGLNELTLSVDYFPHEVAVSKDGNILYVSNYGKDHVRSNSPANRPGRSLSVIDLRAPMDAYQVDLGVGCAPHGLFVADSGKVYVTCEMRNEVLVIQGSQVIAHIPTGQEQSHMVVVDKDEQRAYTANFSAGSVSVLHIPTRQVIAVLPLAAGIEGVALSPDGEFIYATSVLEGQLFKINAHTLKVVGEIATDKSPVRVSVTPDGSKILVNCSADGTLVIYEPTTFTRMTSVALGQQPIGVSVPDNTFAYFATMKDNEVVQVDLRRAAVRAKFATGNKPDGIVAF